MKNPRFIARQEIGAEPFAAMLASCLNIRFVGFLKAFADRHNIPQAEALESARELLRNAEIPQDE